MANVKVTAAMGDGIGKEIMQSTLDIIKASGAPVDFDQVKVGKDVYLQGNESGIPDEAWDSMRENKVLLKGPITTPQGGGYKSLNVTIRKTMGLFANVRPVKAFSPYVQSNFPDMDVVVIRENEEDLYAGIEYQQSPEVVQSLKLISRPGCEKIVRYAFEYAKAYGRKRVTCMSKDNIMKHADGLFHQVFKEVAAEYPDIESDHYIIDIGTARVANSPEKFDVIVTLNLYGDILSDVTAEISGSVGLGGSANIGQTFAMFEAIHGSAPDISGKDIANPSGLLHGACMMLVHINLPDYAQKIQSALYKTIEDGIHTVDLECDKTEKVVGTKEFTQAIIERLGQVPSTIKFPKYSDYKIEINLKDRPRETKKLVGMDVFLDWTESDRDANVLGEKLKSVATDALSLKIITSRGVKVYPDGHPETFCADHWCCRFVPAAGDVNLNDTAQLISKLIDAGFDVIKTENLYEFDGKRGYSLAQGE